MRALLQRVRNAAVDVEGKTVGAIRTGWLILLGITGDDQASDIDYLCQKILNLRLFSNDAGKFDKSITDISGELLVVSQFTLYADCRKGRRPNFSNAAPPETAERLYEAFISQLRMSSELSVQTGQFGAAMDVTLTNDGPVTVMLDSQDCRDP